MKLCCEKLQALLDDSLELGATGFVLWIGHGYNPSDPHEIACCPFCGAHLSWFIPQTEAPKQPPPPSDSSRHVGESATVTVIEEPHA